MRRGDPTLDMDADQGDDYTHLMVSQLSTHSASRFIETIISS